MHIPCLESKELQSIAWLLSAREWLFPHVSGSLWGWSYPFGEPGTSSSLLLSAKAVGSKLRALRLVLLVPLMCSGTAGIQWGSARNTTVPGELPRLQKSCSAAREGKTKFSCWLPWPQYSLADVNANTPPSGLQRSRHLYLPAPSLWFPLNHAYLASNSGPHLPLPGCSLGAAPWWWRAVLVLCTLLCSSLRSCSTLLTSSPLCLSSAQGKSSLKSLLLWRRTGTTWSTAPPRSQNRHGKAGGLCSNLPNGMSSSVWCAGVHLWKCEPDQLHYLSQASWGIPGAQGVFSPSPDW